MKNKHIRFFDEVYHVVRQIPFGRVTTYGHIAKFLGTKQSSRMVGWAMNASHTQTNPVPAHRVVNRAGLLTGKNHFQTENMMEKLLENEGVKIENNQVKDFERLLWIPLKELNKCT